VPATKPTTPSTSLGPTLRRLRLDRGLTQAQLAERADLADATLSRIERGRLVPSVVLARRLADALGVEVDELLKPKKKTPAPPALRPVVARLVALTDDMTDAQVDDVRRALALMLAVGRKATR